MELREKTAEINRQQRELQTLRVRKWMFSTVYRDDRWLNPPSGFRRTKEGCSQRWKLKMSGSRVSYKHWKWGTAAILCIVHCTMRCHNLLSGRERKATDRAGGYGCWKWQATERATDIKGLTHFSVGKKGGSWCVGKVRTCSQCCSFLSMASYSWLERTHHAPLYTTLNIFFTVLLLFLRYTVWTFWLTKEANSSACLLWACLRRGLLTPFCTPQCSKTWSLWQSHGFLYNLGMIAQVTGNLRLLWMQLFPSFTWIM